MPGTTTHGYILYKALEGLGEPPKEGDKTVMQELAASSIAAKNLATQNKPASLENDPKGATVLAGCAYLGCFGPDLFYLETGAKGLFVADLHHYNCTSLFMIWCLKRLKKRGFNKYSNAVKREFAYVMGHICHIAADINLHPYVNSVVAAYPENQKIFSDPGRYTWTPGPLWKLHNILEHHHDNHMLHSKFIGEEKFGKNWETVNVARVAADFYTQKSNVKERFLLRNSKDYYRFTKNYDDDLERDKYRFFQSNNWFLDIQAYYNTTLAKEDMLACKRMTQPELLDKYIDAAVKTTKTFWDEAVAYITAVDKEDDTLEANDLSLAKKYFPKLRKHWNLDCGFAPEVKNKGRQWDISKDQRVHIAGDLKFKSVHSKEWEDVKYS
jgi:hypothetical protein